MDKNLTCGHLFTRAAYSTRWDERNAWAQCAGCNLRHEYDFYPMMYAVKNRGIDIDALHADHSKTMHLANGDLQRLIEEYEKKLALPA